MRAVSVKLVRRLLDAVVLRMISVARRDGNRDPIHLHPNLGQDGHRQWDGCGVDASAKYQRYARARTRKGASGIWIRNEGICFL